MFKKTVIAGFIAGALGSGVAQAQAPASPHTLTGNIGFYSQYVFRGLKQTDGDPALQGGFDYSHASGFYAGTWASNISWLRDFGAYRGGASLEWDVYGGYRGTIGKTDLGYDVGLLLYYYPGTVAPGVTKANTLEAYGALTYKWLTTKYSYSIENTFGTPNSDGSWYLDFTLNAPVTEKLALQAHYGIQEFDGVNGAGVDNDSFASYKDWKLGFTYALPQSFTIGAFYTDTDMNAAQTAWYTSPAGREIGKGTFTVFVSKTF